MNVNGYDVPEKLMDALVEDFARRGEEAIETLREYRPEAYLRVIAALSPDVLAEATGKSIHVTISPQDAKL